MFLVAATPEEPLMSQHESCLAQLLSRVQEGQPGAAEEFVALYGPHLLRIVRRNLNRRLRSKFDSQDFVQSVWASFFANYGQFGGGLQIHDMAAYLGAIARNKTIDEVRKRLRTQKYRVSREVAGDAAADPAATGRVPTPSETAVVRETWNHLTGGRSNRSVQVFEMRRHGVSHVEIAERLGVNERTVRRILDRAERRLERRLRVNARSAGNHSAGKDLSHAGR
jgi:RNA polymerase sigma factor (sigma-70 family)